MRAAVLYTPRDKADFATGFLGVALAGQAKFAEAEPLLIRAYGALVARRSTVNREEWKWVEEFADTILRLYTDSNQPAKLAEWKQKIAAVKTPAARRSPRVRAEVSST